jgi:hypothetical protein
LCGESGVEVNWKLVKISFSSFFLSPRASSTNNEWTPKVLFVPKYREVRSDIQNITLKPLFKREQM